METGEVERRQLKRQALVTYLAKQAPAVIAMEACGSAHYWARRFSSLGHQVRLIAPRFVRPFVKSNRTNLADPASRTAGCGSLPSRVKCSKAY